jgi:hypothetical protein
MAKLTPPDASYLSREETLRIARQKGIAGLSTLQSLLSLYTKSPSILDPQILLSLIAFTSARDPWTTPLAVSNTTSVLSKHAHQTHTPSFIIDYILQQFIRPLFAKSKPEAITASGRKAMPSSAPPRRFESADQELTSKRWMYQVPYTITVFEWIVANSSVSSLFPVAEPHPKYRNHRFLCVLPILHLRFVHLQFYTR